MKSMRLPRYVSLGGMPGLRERPDADRIAYTLGQGSFDDFTIKRYASRKALEAFCKHGSRHHALVKTVVAPSMLINQNTQRTA